MRLQYYAALAITGAIKCTSCSKLYKKLGLESLESRRRLTRLCFLHKIISNRLPVYVYKLIPKKSHQYITRNVNDIATYQCRTDAFKFSFYPWTITEWNEIDIKIQNSSYSVFRNYLLKEIKPKPSLLYNIHNPSGIKSLTRLKLGLSHLNEHKFNQILTIVLILFAPPVWNLSQHHTSFCTTIIIIQCNQYLRIWTQKTRICLNSLTTN